MIRAHAPGRVNLIGDHTDHTGGLVLPMAIDLGTTVEGEPEGEVVELRSDWTDAVARVPLDVADPTAVDPEWARYVAGVVAELRPAIGFRGTVSTTLPVGAGLSSSAALEIALALALGADGPPLALAQLGQRAEQTASSVPCGIMDQLASTAGVAGHALRIDCTSFEVTPVPLPEHLEVVVVDSGQRRSLAGSAYAERADACRVAQDEIGPLRSATLTDVRSITDEVVRRRARHVVTENARVDAFAAALGAGDLQTAGEAMAESHASLRDDFEVSTPVLDALVARLARTPGVLGARLTGAGFGGCAVALVDRGAALPHDLACWRVQPSGGARLL
ncbi:MAG: galactokinase [Acidimicrobiales bacterium]